MTELGEMVAEVAGPDDDCPFVHYPYKKPPPNKWTNSSDTLGKNLATEFAKGTKLYLPHLEETTVATGPSGKKNYSVSYNPHHVLPGDASWPKTALKKWIDEAEEGLVREDIGYDVNGYQNGIDLPSSNELKGNWKPEAGRSVDFQARYAFAAMDADGKTRQFHDAHPAYSDFATNMMDKIAAKLEETPARKMGCGDEDCTAGKKKPFPPPLGLKARIYSASDRLAKFLFGSPRKWKLPIFTSRFALMYKNRKLTQEQATDKLSTENFSY